MEISIRVAGEKDAGLWDTIARNSTLGSAFHTWKWLKIAAKHTRTTLYPLIGIKGETPIGLYPLFHQRTAGLSRVFSPPPGSAIPYLGPIIDQYETLRQSKKESTLKTFQRAADAYIEEELHARYTTVSVPPFLDPRPFLWTGYELRPIFDYHLDLTKGTDALWKDLDPNLKGHIQRAEKSQVRIVDGTKDDLRAIHDSLRRRYDEQRKVLTVTPEYLCDLYDAFHPGNLRVFAAKRGEDIVGGVVTVLHRGRILYWIGGAKPGAEKSSPNDLAQWEAIRWAAGKGMTLYEEIGSGTERLSEFKAKYNPTLSVRFMAVKASPLARILEAGYHRLFRNLYLKLSGTYAR
jgi:CelD/BcsL family acetyltransferase involved in cellulose biosynthesis